MFSSLKYLAVAAGFWGSVLSALVFAYSDQQVELRLLNDTEMLRVAKGAAPAQACTTYQLITMTCGDWKNGCIYKPEPQCNGSCEGCTLGNLQETYCDEDPTKPWVFLCNQSVTRNGCGKNLVSPTCQYVEGQCQCLTDQGSWRDCDQSQDTLNTQQKCTASNPPR